MTEALISSILAFIGTNLDDIFLLTLFFSAVQADRGVRAVWCGQYLGIFILCAVSLAGAFGLSFLPEKYICFLGILPILLGLKAIFSRGEEENQASSAKMFYVTLVTVANGADNIGVYIPLFAGFSVLQMGIAIAIFMLMTALLCFLGQKISALPFLRAFLLRYHHIIVPLVLIALGIYILLSGIFSL